MDLAWTATKQREGRRGNLEERGERGSKD